MSPILWWIRRDLRINNNPTLKTALKIGDAVIPVFIQDDRLLKTTNSNRQRFLLSGLQELGKQLLDRGSGLVIRHGDPVVELKRLIQETAATLIYAEEDFSSFARKRDKQVARELPLQLVTGLTVFHPEAVLKPDGSPYTVFSPYSRTWKSLPLAGVANSRNFEKLPAINIPPSNPLPEYSPVAGFPAGEIEATRRLDEFLQTRLANYDENRNRMDLDGTSSLSPYFRFGMISAVEAVTRVRGLLESQGAQTWLNEIIWREFYHSILYHFPHVQAQSFNPKLRNIPWRNSTEDLKAWKNGETGYPVVDAAMRQLLATGWMHNRARMIVASFLTKDLLINWQEGERWFMQQLVDGDIAANNGGWQWTAGTGTDAAPYFRIFNPVLQSKKFDPDGSYIRRWVPELQSVPDEWIHEPWKMPELLQIKTGMCTGLTYPAPIVEHGIVKDRTLAAYKASQQS
jgi:deoxyribodipyrimidine photo-lyase